MRKLKNLNIFILVILFLLGFAVFYFLYNRQRSQAFVYITVSLTRPVNTLANILPNAVPFWIGNSIDVGDKEMSPFGGLSAEVIGKESYESLSYGQLVNLLLKVNAVKDRTGIYLFKNKPLSVGSLIDLKLTKTQASGIITDLSYTKPVYKFQKLIIEVKGLAEDNWVVDAINIGSQIKSGMGDTLAKVIDKKVSNSQLIGILATDPSTNRPVMTFDRSKKDLTLKIRLTAKMIGDSYYLMDSQKVKVDEKLYLPFPETSINFPIISVTEVK